MEERGVPLQRRSVWIAQAGSIIGLLAYVFIVRLLAPAFVPPDQPVSAHVGWVLAVVPAVLWLALFYSQDAQEPEPLGYVLRVAVAGGILGGAIALPVMRAFDVTSWMYADPVTTLLGSILVTGAIQQACNYLAIRFTVYDHAEFDEVGDGVTYGSAAGLGLATVLSLSFVLNSPGIIPLNATLRIVVTALAHASFGGLLGYFMGRAKLYGRNLDILWGYLQATILNGAFTFLLGEVIRSGLAYRPWNGLALATGMAIIVMVGLFWLVRARAAVAA